MNTLSEDQKVQYGNFWQLADADMDGQIGQNDALSFFSKSGLSMDVLGSIWGQVNPNSAPTLSPDQFVFACQLISMGQNGRVPNLGELQQLKAGGAVIPLPSFGGAPTPAPAPTPSYAQPPAPANPMVLPGSGGLEATAADHQTAQGHFSTLDTDRDGYVSGADAYQFFLLSGLSQDVLAQVWSLSDADNDGRLDVSEFTCATFLITQLTQQRMVSLPATLPPSLVASIWKNKAPAAVQSLPGVAPAAANPLYVVTTEELTTDSALFQQHNSLGYIEGGAALTVLRMSGLPDDELGRVYSLADSDQDGRLSQTEFFAAMKLIRVRLAGHQLPATLPVELTVGGAAPVAVTASVGGASGAVTKVLEDRIAELTAKNSALESENNNLKVAGQTIRDERDRAQLRAQELESQLSQANARVSALGETASQASAALSQIQQLSVQLNDSYTKLSQQQAAYSELESRYNQQGQQLQTTQQQLSAAQQQVALNAAKATSLPPPVQANPFGGAPAQANPFGATPSTPFGVATPAAASSTGPNPFMMGVDTSAFY